MMATNHPVPGGFRPCRTVAEGVGLVDRDAAAGPASISRCDAGGDRVGGTHPAGGTWVR